ncbi:MAG: 23S rRNA (adenine(2503)-C(2))-methyltransferase RlmN, partial [Phototrophicales bacterium]
MLNLYAMSLSDIEALFKEWGEAKYRARQLWEWLYDKRVSNFAAMTNLPKTLRTRLAAETTLGVLSIAAEQSSRDGTVKRLYRLPDGQLIEAVLMEYDDDRRTACISTQAGCAMGCVFC